MNELARRNLKRADVANVLIELLRRPDAAGLVLDLVTGHTPAEFAVDVAVEKRLTDWVG